MPLTLVYAHSESYSCTDYGVVRLHELLLNPFPLFRIKPRMIPERIYTLRTEGLSEELSLLL